MPRRTGSYKPLPNVEHLPRLWPLRLLVPLGGHQHVLGRHGFNDDHIAKAVGMEKWLKADLEYDQKKALQYLRRLHTSAEKRIGLKAELSLLFKGTKRLARLVQLTPQECRVLEFVVAINTDSILNSAADCLGRITTSRIFCVVATVTGLQLETVKEVLNVKGRLVRSGLLTIDWRGTDTLQQKLKLLSAHFGERLRIGESNPLTLLQGMVNQAPPPSLAISDYPHLDASLRVLLHYLRKSLEGGRFGVNILFHGPPGTGKTQLCRVLSQALNARLYEVVCTEEGGESLSGGGRLRACRAAQRFFAGSFAMLLFDEIEDAFRFSNEVFSLEASASERKNWVNHALEENPIPTFWLTNDVHSLDPAFVRRFDMVVEFPVPPRSQREKIIREICHKGLDEHHVRAIARSEHLAPAVITRAASVLQVISGDLQEIDVPEAFRRIIDSTLTAQGHPVLSRSGSEQLPHCYDPALLNTSVDLAGVTRGLARTRSGRLCLYGPPGTGKTAYGHWLAEQLGLPLVAKRASDLLSMWVGQSEKNIANAFKQAERDSRVLGRGVREPGR